MHASGQRPLEEVFGPVVATTKGPNLEAYRCDIVCIFKNSLKNYDPILPELVIMALNAIHKVTHLSEVNICISQIILPFKQLVHILIHAVDTQLYPTE